MKKIKLSLFVKVLIAIALGSLLGLVAPDLLVRLFKTFNVLFAQILKFIVPLLVLGLVTPAIYGLGKALGHRTLTVCVAIANRVSKKFSSDYKPHVKRLIETVLERVVNI